MFKPTSKSNPCPICSDISGDCRNPGEAVVLCMKTTADVSGYKYKGLSSNGLWGKFVIDDGRSHQSHSQSQRQSAKAVGKAAKKGSTLTVYERDNQYRKLLGILPVKADDFHIQDLKRRGLTESQITLGMYRSVVKGQKLAKPLTDLHIAGLSHDGTNLTVPADGYLTPIFDYKHRIQGCQLRVKNPTEGCGKYLWLKTYKFDDGFDPRNEITSHIINGELPIGVYSPENPTKEYIGTSEGHIKPNIIAHRFGCTVLGAAGGQFASSPETFKKQIEEISKKIGTRLVIDYVDAGTIFNPQVIRQLRKKWHLLTTWGFDVKIATWDAQNLKKSEGGRDADEINSEEIRAIHHISIENFAEICLEWDSPDALKIKERLGSQLTKASNDIFDGIDLEKLALKIPKEGVICLPWGKGFGKTELMAIANKNTPKTIALSHLLSLLSGLTNRLGLNLRNDFSGKNTPIPINYREKLGVCLPSLLILLNLSDSDWADYDLILDEVDQLCDVATSSKTCNNNGMRTAILSVLTRAIANSKRLWLASADLSDREIDLVMSIRRKNDLWLIENTRKVEGYKAIFVNSYDHKGRLTPDGIRQKAKDLATNGKKLLVMSDSIATTKSMAKMLEKSGIQSDRILLINSDTSGELKQKSFVKQPNLEVGKYQVVICSPSVNSGVSIDGEYFDAVIGMFSNRLTADLHSQALIRARDLGIPRYIYCSDSGAAGLSKISDSTNPYQVLEAIKSVFNQETRLLRNSLGTDEIFGGIDTRSYDWSNVWLSYYCQKLAWKNQQLENPQMELIERLKLEGNEVIFESSRDVTCSSYTEATEAVLEELTKAKLASHPLFGKDLTKLRSKKDDLTQSEKIILEVSEVCDFYKETQLTEKILDFDGNGKTRRQVRELELFLDNKSALDLDLKDYFAQCDWLGVAKSSNLDVFAPDVSTRLLRATKRREMFGDVVKKFMDLCKLIDDNPKLEELPEIPKSEIEAFAAKVRSHKEDCKKILNFTLPVGASDNWIFSMAMDQIALPIKSSRIGKNKATVYRFDLENLKQIKEILQKRGTLTVRDLTVDTPPSVIYTKQGGVSTSKPNNNDSNTVADVAQETVYRQPVKQEPKPIRINVTDHPNYRWHMGTVQSFDNGSCVVLLDKHVGTDRLVRLEPNTFRLVA